MSLKPLRENILLAALLVFVFLLCKERFAFTALIILFFFYAKRASPFCALILVSICLSLLIPFYDMSEPSCEEARVTEIHENYAIARKGRTKVLIYTNGPALLDSVIGLDGPFEKIEGQSSFYGFDFAEYMKRKGVGYAYAGDDMPLIKEHHTPRAFLQKRIEEIENPYVSSFVYKVLFNCADDTLIQGSFLANGGFSYAGMMLVMEAVLKYFLSERKRKYAMILINIALIFFYGFQMILVSALLRRLIREFIESKEERCGAWIILMIVLFRRQILSAAFFMPLCFSLSPLYEKDRFFIRESMLCMAQSALYHRVSPFDLLFYPFLVRIYGLLWFAGILFVFFPFAAPEGLITLFSRFSLVTERFCIYGTWIGFGLPLFLVWIMSFYRKEYFAKITFVSFIIFLVCGLFHPFAEVCFINVGQGDCILVKGPFQTDTVLIDTGKASRYRCVEAALHARGITKIDTFFITHADSDHAGSMETVMDSFRVAQMITEHKGTTYSRYLVFHDLNSLENEDENQSSLALAFSLNGLDFMMCGDIDQFAEETIVRKFTALQCDVLKLSHHGSKTGSCDLWLDTLRPDLGIVSSGAYSIYHHPSPETVQRLLKRHIPYLDTKDHGDISIFMIGPFRLLITSDLCFELL